MYVCICTAYKPIVICDLGVNCTIEEGPLLFWRCYMLYRRRNIYFGLPQRDAWWCSAVYVARPSRCCPESVCAAPKTASGSWQSSWYTDRWLCSSIYQSWPRLPSSWPARPSSPSVALPPKRRCALSSFDGTVACIVAQYTQIESGIHPTRPKPLAACLPRACRQSATLFSPAWSLGKVAELRHGMSRVSAGSAKTQTSTSDIVT